MFQPYSEGKLQGHGRRYYPGFGPQAQINGVVLDGSGNGQAFAATRSANGVISFTAAPGPVTYTVNADCTGTATFPGDAHFNIVVDKKGAGWFFIRTDSGFQASGYSIRLAEDSDEVCSNSTMKGSYRAIGGGTVEITGPGTGVPTATVNNLEL